MNFNDQEISTQDGRPAALYLLEWGNTRWAYTSADQDITFLTPINGENVLVPYKAIAISDSGMVQGGSAQNDFTVDCPINLPVVELFIGTPPNETIWLTVRRIHKDENEAPIHWPGNITNVKRTGAATAQLIGRPLSASFKRTGIRLCWTRECPHFLYDSGCKVDPEDFRVNATVLSKTGTTLTVNTIGGRASGWFSGGFLSWEANSDGTLERRMIESQQDKTMTVFGLTDGVEVGQTVAMYAGCDRSPSTCRDKFDNLANAGDYHFMPGETPFGTIIF